MEAILKVKDFIDKALGYLVGGILLIMAIVITVAVIDRYIGGSMAWTDELVRAGVVWTTFLGSYVAITKYKDIRVEIFVNKMPPKTQGVCMILSDLIILAFLVVFVSLAFPYVIQFAKYKLPMTGMTRGFLYSVFPLGGCMMLLHYILSLIIKISHLISVSYKSSGGGSNI